MNTDTVAQRLHDRATRGEALSAAERAQLDEWYAQLDREEGLIAARAVSSASIVALQTQIEDALVQLATLTQRNQALTAENATVRREVEFLQQQLAKRSTPQPA